MSEQELAQEVVRLREAIERLENRLGEKGFLDAQTMKGLVGIESTYEGVKRVLTSLFDDSTGERARELRDALVTNEPTKIRAVLSALNTVDGKPANPLFNSDQLKGLRELLTREIFRAISPIGNPAGEPPHYISREALAFWRELLSKRPDEVHDFHITVTRFSDEPDNPLKLAAVMALLYLYAPRGRWTREHAEALAVMNRDKIEFKSLKWFPYPGEFW